MDRRRYTSPKAHPVKPFNANSEKALAEHYTISKTPFARGLKVINTERATVPMREKIYAEGGILSVTSRILVVDLLSSMYIAS
jgi:hypothetical protein